MTATAEDLVDGIAAVAERLQDLPGRISGLVIGVQRLQGPRVDPHSPRRREAFRAEAHALVDESWALTVEIGRLLETARTLQPGPRLMIDRWRRDTPPALPPASAIAGRPVRGPRIGRQLEGLDGGKR
ncbi:MAG: hypothetical protein Q7W02_02395 [Candidatus Rokubacteria bacterium]|nr:hypothetical protein [Candidatus Rokubacteria bacterium]